MDTRGIIVKKRIRMFIMIILIAFVIGLVIWRFWPHSFFNAISVKENSIDRVSVHAMINRFETEQDTIDTYLIDDINQPINMLDEIIEILSASNYRQDFRNLLPWGLDYVDADKNYDGRTVTVSFYMGNHKDEYTQIQFLSSSIIVVSTGGKTGFRVYHPANIKTIDQLVEYLQTYGVKQ